MYPTLSYSSSEKQDRSTSDSPGADIDSAGDCVGITSFGSCPLLNFGWGLSRYQFISGWSPCIYLWLDLSRSCVVLLGFPVVFHLVFWNTGETQACVKSLFGKWLQRARMREWGKWHRRGWKAHKVCATELVTTVNKLKSTLLGTLGHVHLNWLSRHGKLTPYCDLTTGHHLSDPALILLFCMRLLTPDIDQERDPERVFQFSYNFLGRNGTPCRVTQRYTEQRLKRVPVPLLWIQQEGKGQAWQTGLGLANVNIFSTLWSTEVVPDCSVTWPWDD